MRSLLRYISFSQSHCYRRIVGIGCRSYSLKHNPASKPVMKKFSPQTFAENEIYLSSKTDAVQWTPLLWHECTFPSGVFDKVMENLIRNPNINSNHLFRADILHEASYPSGSSPSDEGTPRVVHVEGFDLETTIVRKLIPRKPQLDNPLDQTCLLYTSANPEESKSLVVYIPHIDEPAECPFYHPTVKGIAFLHEYDPQAEQGKVSVHFSFFDSEPRSEKLERTAQHLLATLHKHGQGLQAGYQKRVHHDVVVPQAPMQNTYSRLKTKYAKALIQNWAEVTDPTKHVFEDLCIAAFLIELWKDMYGDNFPGFVDIGCGNGLLTHILREEGYKGWGFDARRRKSWEVYPESTRSVLKEAVLIPSILQDAELEEETAETNSHTDGPSIVNGIFEPGTFIISNHADELTPWTPLLGTLNDSPFLMIPCCSHNLTGSHFRARPPKVDRSAQKVNPVAGSAYAALVAWVSKLGEDCGWVIETEMLRIPSTRNTGLIGRKRNSLAPGEEPEELVRRIVREYGGAAGWAENAMKLVKTAPKSH